MKRYQILYETEANYIKDGEISDTDKRNIVKLAIEISKYLDVGVHIGYNRKLYIDTVRLISQDESKLNEYLDSKDMNIRSAAKLYKDEKASLLQGYKDSLDELNRRFPGKEQ